MKKKRADKLAKDYELGSNAVDYFKYIVDSLIQGQRQQVRKLFNQMHKEDKSVFMNKWLEGNEYHLEVKEICIEELIR